MILSRQFIDGMLYCATNITSPAPPVQDQKSADAISATSAPHSSHSTLCFLVLVKSVHALFDADITYLQQTLHRYELSSANPQNTQMDDPEAALRREQQISEATARLTGNTEQQEVQAVNKEAEACGESLDEEEVWAAEEDPDDFVYEGDPICTPDVTLTSAEDMRAVSPPPEALTEEDLQDRISDLLKQLSYGLVAGITNAKWEALGVTDAVLKLACMLYRCSTDPAPSTPGSNTLSPGICADYWCVKSSPQQMHCLFFFLFTRRICELYVGRDCFSCSVTV
jgi:hypothetical protein